jgi:E3 ubiquitin-protein ligase RNF115/126
MSLSLSSVVFSFFSITHPLRPRPPPACDGALVVSPCYTTLKLPSMSVATVPLTTLITLTQTESRKCFCFFFSGNKLAIQFCGDASRGVRAQSSETKTGHEIEFSLRNPNKSSSFHLPCFPSRCNKSSIDRPTKVFWGRDWGSNPCHFILLDFPATMSWFSSASAATASPAPLRYYCHQCDRDVSIAPPASRDADVFCPLCGGGFVEELPPLDNPSLSASGGSFLFASPPSFDLRQPSDLSTVFGPPSSASPRFDPSNFLHDHFGGLLSSGATIQIVIEGGGGGAPGLNLADYFMGPGGLEQLIQQLAENDPNRYGTPPAAKSAVAALPDVIVSADIMQVDGGAQCAVCMDDFLLGASAKQLPCKHVFHKDCIMPWLDLHSSCPVCRFELPTDDTDYQPQNQHRQPFPSPRPQAPTAAALPRVAERRFRISLPLSLRAAFGGAAQAETSNPTAQPHTNGDDEPSGENYNDNTTGVPQSGCDDLD